MAEHNNDLFIKSDDPIKHKRKRVYLYVIGILGILIAAFVSMAASTLCPPYIIVKKQLNPQMEKEMTIAQELEKADQAAKVIIIRKLGEIIHELQPKLDSVIADKIVSEIITNSKTHGLDPALITALIWEESRFKPLAASKKGAIGLMQIRYSTWKEDPILLDNGVEAQDKLYWIDLNIICGTSILKKYLDESKGHITKALWRYNSGAVDFPKDKKYYEIGYANRILIKTYQIREELRCIKKDLEDPNALSEEEEAQENYEGNEEQNTKPDSTPSS